MSSLGYLISAVKQVDASTDLLKIAKGRHKMPTTWKEVVTQIKREWR